MAKSSVFQLRSGCNRIKKMESGLDTHRNKTPTLVVLQLGRLQINCETSVVIVLVPGFSFRLDICLTNIAYVRSKPMGTCNVNKQVRGRVP